MHVKWIKVLIPVSQRYFYFTGLYLFILLFYWKLQVQHMTVSMCDMRSHEWKCFIMVLSSKNRIMWSDEFFISQLFVPTEPLELKVCKGELKELKRTGKNTTPN